MPPTALDTRPYVSLTEAFTPIPLVWSWAHETEESVHAVAEGRVIAHAVRNLQGKWEVYHWGLGYTTLAMRLPRPFRNKAAAKADIAAMLNHVVIEQA